MSKDEGRGVAAPGAPHWKQDDEVLPQWLRDHPHAMVGAVDQAGMPVDMPASIPLGRGHQVDSRSLLDLVVPDDVRAVAEAFVAGLQRGASVARVRMASDPEHPLVLQYLNLLGSYGVVLRTLVPAVGPDESGPAPAPVSSYESARPRLGEMTMDEVGTILSADDACSLMLGWSSDELVGRPALELVHPDDQIRTIDSWTSRFSSTGASLSQSVQLRLLCRDGSWAWMEMSHRFQRLDDGSSIAVIRVIDISEQMAATEALRRNERYLRRLTDTVPVGLFHVDDERRVVFVNPVLHELIGRREVHSEEQLVEALAPGQSDLLEAAIDEVFSQGVDRDLDISLAVHEDGSRWSYRITLRAVTDASLVLGVLGCVMDVTELRALADTDVLTGIPNRRWIMEVLAADLREHHGRVAVIFVDLDAFKPVNDRFGHRVGDELLVQVSERLRGALRPTDRFGRLGGDEFLVVCPGLSGQAAALEVALRVQETLHSEFILPEASLTVTASCGVAVGYPGATVDDLVSAADAAMYEAKENPGGPPRFHRVGPST